VLLKKQGGNLADALAPGNDSVALMLPITPLHYLLLEDMPLVMTSGNAGGDRSRRIPTWRRASGPAGGRLLDARSRYHVPATTA